MDTSHTPRDRPGPPTELVLTIDSDNVKLTWKESNPNGFTVTGYSIILEANDAKFDAVDMDNLCDKREPL